MTLQQKFKRVLQKFAVILFHLQGFLLISHLRGCLSLLDESKKSNSWKVEYPKKTSSEIIAELNTHQIIPEIVKEVSTNVSVCEVSYDDTVVNFGNIINYTRIQAHAPTHVKWPFEKGILYTLIMTSPDAPAREYHKEREVIMWLVGNIPENDIENGTTIADYVGMVPFYVEGLHRYIYFVYEQEDAGLMSVFGVWIESIDRSDALSFPEKTPKQIRDALVKYAIVRRILPHAPKHAVEVAYGDAIVNFGNKLTPEQIEDQPDHISWPIKKDTFYTLVLSGPDVPTHEKAVDKEIQHWVVGNIPGNNVSAGETLTEYRGIIPLYEPGSHRLCYYVYEQPDEEKVTFKDEHVNKSVIGYQRAFFHAEVVRSKYNYEEAIAANFFIVDTTEEDQQMTAR